MAWMKLTAKGRAGHGSFLNDDNAVTALTEAVTRIGRHTFPVQLTPTMQVVCGRDAERTAEAAARALGPRLGEGDLLITVGAGDIHRLAEALVDGKES